MKHINNGNCPKCEEIFARYKGFHIGLKDWFKKLQAAHPEAHISCAGRGEQDQEEVFRRGASKAHWTKSAHNWNAAIDLFEMGGASTTNLYERKWFDAVVAPAITKDFKWYGAPGASFFELPHVEVSDWRALAQAGKLSLVK